jgi:hypothetical protein
LASVLCAAFVVACGSFGASADAPADGGGVPAPDASDATTANETSTPFVCPSNVIWCETFDVGFARWVGAAAPAHTIGMAPDLGNIAVINIPEGKSRHTITRDVPAFGRDVHVELSLRLAAPNPDFPTDGSANVAVAGVELPGVGAVALFVDRKDSTPAGRFYITATASVDGAFNFAEGEDVPYGEWHRVSLEFRFGAAQSYGFAVAGSSHKEALPKLVDKLPSPLFIGAYRPNDDTPALTIDFDDIVVTSL